MKVKTIKEALALLDQFKAEAKDAIDAAEAIRDAADEAIGFLLADGEDPDPANLHDLIGPELDEIDRQVQEVKRAAADLDELL
jgi:hypothetical protein